MTGDDAPRVRHTISEHGVADVRLDRPAKHNALDAAMFAAIVATGRTLATDPTVRAVVLSGEGRSFCSGLDFGGFDAMAEGRRISLEDEPDEPVGPAAARGQKAAWVWAQMPVPVIAAVHGVAFGGGLQIALAADLRIVAPDARLCVMEVHWGLVPDMTGTRTLPDLVGRDVAKELVFTGREVSGTEAVALGLATRADDAPRAAALALAGEIAAKSPDAIRHAKALLDLAGRVPLAEGFAAEQETVAALVGTPNQREAIAARRAQRPPSFG